MKLMENVSLSVVGSLLALSLAGVAQAQEKTFPIQGRLFLATTSIKPDELNQLMSADNLKSFDKLGKYGVEITYPLLRYLDVGMRYARQTATTLDPGASTTNSYYGTLSQDAILLLARVPIIRSTFFKFDVFGGVGGTNTTFEIKSATDDGQLTRKASDNWVASPYLSAGASAGFGYKKFYLYIEGGYDRNQVSDLTRTGTISGTVNTIQLTGPYFMIGLLFDGISGYKN